MGDRLAGEHLRELRSVDSWRPEKGAGILAARNVCRKAARGRVILSEVHDGLRRKTIVKASRAK